MANDGPLVKEAETSFRAGAARSNYLSIDRPDCQFASKEIVQTDDNTDAKRARTLSKDFVATWLAGRGSSTCSVFKRHRAFMCTLTQIGQDVPAREKALQVAP